MRVLLKSISVCLIAALIVAACGSSDSSTDETTTTTTSATAATSSPATSSPATQPSTTTTEAAAPSSTTATAAPAATTLPPTTTSTVPEPLPNSQVRVIVFNGSGVSGAAGRLTGRIAERGYIRTSPANAPRSYSSSVIYYTAPEYSANARQLAEDVGLADSAIAGLLPDPAPVDSGEAHLIVIIGRDELADSLRAQAEQQGGETPSTSSDRGENSASTTSSSTTTTTTSSTTPRPDIVFPTATTVVPEETTSPEVTVPPVTQAPSTDGGPPPVPVIDFGALEALATANISVVVRSGADEGGQLRYQVTRGDELTIHVVSEIGTGTVRVERYGLSEATTLFSGAWISFTANRSGVFNISFTPDSTGEEEVIFQIDVS